MLKWSGIWLDSHVTAPLSGQDPGIYIPNCEATGCWHCCFTGDEQRHRGCWDLADVSQVVCGGCSGEKDDGQPSEEVGEPRHLQIPMLESKGRALLWGSTKTHPWWCPLQLCVAAHQLYTPPEKTWSEKHTAIKYPQRVFHFRKAMLKPWWCVWCLRAGSQGGKGDALLGQGGHKQPLGKLRRRSWSPEWCGWGERWGQRKINRCKAAPRRKARTGRTDTAGAVFLPPNSLSGSIIFYLLWVSPCAIESTSWNKAKAEAS